MDADGGNQTQVTHGSVEKVNPGFSSSGRRIVYASAPYDGRPSIFKIRPDGMKGRRIVGPDATSPVFSPGGRRIAFDGTPNGARRAGIWTVRRDGSHLRRLTGPRRAGVVDHVLDWSPDGKHLLFDRCKAEIHSCHGGNWVMRADGSHKHPIDAPGEVYSPSGNRFAGVTAEIDDPINFDWGCSDIYTIRATGTGLRLVTHNCEDHNSGDPGPFADFPSWQPIPAP
jgi:Tol biopolymer transport system component